MPQKETVVTLVAARLGDLAPAVEHKAAGLIKDQGVERVRIDTLAAGRAADFILSGLRDDLSGRIYKALSAVFDRLDIFIQPHDGYRKKRLLLADMDATIVEGETLDDLAAVLNLKDQIAPVTAQAMRGDIDFAAALHARVALLKGQDASVLFRIMGDIRISRGAATVVKTMRHHGHRCVLASGGFDVFTGHVAGMLGFDAHFGNVLEIENDRLTGRVLPPVLDKDAKLRILQEECGRMGIEPQQALAVGDGANDIPMLKAAGAGVGYFAKPAVTAAVPLQIRYTDLTSLLYLQGYRQAEIEIAI